MKAFPPVALMLPEAECVGYEKPASSRYTHLPNLDIANNRTVHKDSVKLRSATMKDGVSFCEPMAGQGFNDQFPYGYF